MIRLSFFFFFNDTATTEIYTLSLHDALPIWCWSAPRRATGFSNGSGRDFASRRASSPCRGCSPRDGPRSEEHTSELQSRLHLVCRLLLEKKKKTEQRLRRVNFVLATHTLKYD